MVIKDDCSVELTNVDVALRLFNFTLKYTTTGFYAAEIRMTSNLEKKYMYKNLN